MPIDDALQVRLPRAYLIENEDPGEPQHILVRTYTLKLYANTANAIRQVLLDRILYSPAWAKVDCAVLRSQLEVLKVSGDKGIIPVNLTWTDFEPATIQLFNNSIDTEVRFAINTRGWQVGEG